MGLLFKLFKLGFDDDGYDKYGFNESGYNRFGFNKDGYNQYGFDKDGYDKFGYDICGYNKLGFDKYGYDKQRFNKDGYGIDGFNRQGYDKEGFNKEGFNISGFDRDGYDNHGYNMEGYNKDGFDREGYRSGGYDRLGYDKQGYSRDGFNKYGFDKSGYDKSGKDIDGYNRRGFNIYGFNREGFDKDGFNIRGLNKQGFNRAGFDIHGFDKNGYDKNGFDKNGEHFTKLSVGQTVYHEIYEEGMIDRFENNHRYLIIYFDTVGYKTFSCDMSVFQYISTELPPKLKRRIALKSQGIYDVENNTERKHFDRVIAVIRDTYMHKQIGYSGSFNDFSDGFELDTFSTWQKSSAMNREYNGLLNKPYFARIDHNEKIGLYIGKSEITGEVVDWADPICSLYYDYQMYIGNQDYKLKLVRNFDIINSNYFGFDDVFNESIQKLTPNEDIFVIDDPLLLKIINAERENKRIKDIIATIQSNQYRIITNSRDNNMVVFGCAGSGKTMIMLHRARYILRNKLCDDPGKIFIVSKTNVLLYESKDIIADLMLKEVNTLSTIQFYKFIFVNKYPNLKENINKKFHSIKMDHTLAAEFINETYSEETIDSFNKLVNLTFEDDDIRLDYLCSVKSRLIVELNLLLGEDYLELDMHKISTHMASNMKQFYLKSLEELKEVSNINLTEMKKHMASQKSNKSFRIKVLDFLIEKNKACGPTKKTEKNNIFLNESCLSNTFRLFRLSGFKRPEIVNKLDSSWYNEPYAFYEKFILLLDRINKLFEFEEGKECNYEYYLINDLLFDYKEKHSIPTNSIFEFELFLHLSILAKRLGPVTNDSLLVFIDEFQEYSTAEISMLERLFPNAKFNLFGDVNQCTNAKGITAKESMYSIIANYNKFEISQNYRNARQITEYVNDILGMDMMPIGISGRITESKFDLNQFVLPSNNDRVSFIVKTESFIPTEVALSDSFCIIDSEWDELSRQKINILTINQAKGLEFERVYVLSNGMDNNEKYVAYTRALNELIILNI